MRVFYELRGLHYIGEGNVARKSEFEKLIAELLNSAWWLSFIVAGGAYLFLGVFIPRQFSEHKVLFGLAGMAGSLAPWVALFFCFIGLLAFLNSKRKARLLDSQTDVHSLRQLSWKEFEELVAEAYRRKGYQVLENTMGGADGGVDVRLKRGDEQVLVQCKHWKSYKIGVKVIRELYGVMAAERATRGIVITSGVFTGEARSFAQGKKLDLVDGAELAQMVREVQTMKSTETEQPSAQQQPRSQSVKNCPKCGQEMLKRVARKGQHAGKTFWGCSGYPNCKTVLPLES